MMTAIKRTLIDTSGSGFASKDAGLTWTQVDSQSLIAVASSGDGTKLAGIAIDSSSWVYFFTSRGTTTPGSAGFLRGGTGTAIQLQYAGEGLWMPLNHEGTISAY
jgi:hypothetical protein